MPEVELETPAPLESIYLSRGDEVEPHRPVFSGDVFGSIDAEGTVGEMIIILQHPCALRVAGTQLVPRLLAARIRAVRNVRSNWANESVRHLPLPNLLQTDQTYVADFTDIELIPSTELTTNRTRLAILSMVGVNLLMQRWVHHNSRVTVKTITFGTQIAGPYDEADLASDWCEQLEDLGTDAEELQEAFHEWIRQPWSNESSLTRQQMLDNAQQRPSVRRAMSREIRARRRPSATSAVIEAEKTG